MNIDCLTVVGPSELYYKEMVSQFDNLQDIITSDRLHKELSVQEFAEAILEKAGSTGSNVLLDNPQTDPENNSCVLLATAQDSCKFLFTADAGAQALALATRAYNLANLYWMQIPHHGSRRNITKPLIEHFSPKIANVSACGSSKHPRRAVVNAFKEVGTAVYSTHYPSPTNLCHHFGEVPPRPSYNTATPLWEAK